jgi:hypothetical protein
MTRLRSLAARWRHSRQAAALSACAVALLAALAAPSILGALGSFSGPVGCQSSPDLSDDLTDVFTDDITAEPVAEGSDPCVYLPDTPDGGGDDSGGDAGGDVDDAGVVSATPTFTG